MPIECPFPQIAFCMFLVCFYFVMLRCSLRCFVFFEKVFVLWRPQFLRQVPRHFLYNVMDLSNNLKISPTVIYHSLLGLVINSESLSSSINSLSMVAVRCHALSFDVIRSKFLVLHYCLHLFVILGQILSSLQYRKKFNRSHNFAQIPSPLQFR